MHQRKLSAKPSPLSSPFAADPDASVLFVSTVDPLVRVALETAFPDATELKFYRSVSELTLALPSIGCQNGLILIDLDSEKDQEKLMSLPQSYKQFPLILLASEIDVESCRGHFQAGVEDFLLKPLNLSELIVKTERALASVQKTVRSYLKFLSVLEAELTITELRILSHFFEQPCRTTNRKTLTEHIWSHDRVHPKALDVHLFNLRSKIAKAKMKIDYDPQLKGWRLKSPDSGLELNPETSLS